jgi:DNA-binding NarL/FixJ family response regulator
MAALPLAAAPIFYAPSIGYYVVTRHADIEQVFRDPQTYSAAVAQAPLAPLVPEAQQILLAGGHKPQPSMVGALYRIVAGETVVDPAIIDAAMSSATTNDRLSGLSPRELEVLHLLAQGLADRWVCDQLVLSPRTVASHVRNIFTKLAIPGSDHDNRRVHAVLIYLSNAASPPPADPADALPGKNRPR